MRVKRFLLLESLFLIACAAIAFLVMPGLCKNLGFSLFYDPKSPSSSLDALLKENEARIHSSQKYLHEIDPHHLFEHFNLNRTRFCFVIVTIPRPGDNRYLTQTIVKLVQQLPLLSNYTFTVYNVAGKAHTEAIKLSSKIPVTTLDEKTISLRNEKFPRDKYNRQKHDYQTALRWCEAKESLYSIIIEDDALVDSSFAQKLNFLLHFCLQDKEGDSWGLMKLFYPEKYQGWGNNPSCIGELIVMVILIGTSVTIVSSLLLPGPINWCNCTLNPMLLYWRLFLSISLALFLLLSLGRPHWEELRKLSPFFLSVVPARGCCTPAVLYPRQHLGSLIDYLDTITCNSTVPFDLAIDEWVKREKLKKLLVVPNLFNHIGLKSSLPKGMKALKEFHLLFPPR